MNKFLDEDLTLLIRELKSRNILTVLSASNYRKLKTIHATVYSIALWDEFLAIKYADDYKKIFVNDIKSDLVQLIPLLLMGYKKASALLLRSSIENILKHIFFFDHRIEFEQYKFNGYFQKSEVLVNYLKTHPDINTSFEKIHIVNVLTSHYSELSEIVHGKTAISAEFFDSIRHIKFEQVFYNNFVDRIDLLVRTYNFMLSVFHKEILKELHLDKRHFILSILDTKSHHVFSRHKLK